MTTSQALCHREIDRISTPSPLAPVSKRGKCTHTCTTIDVSKNSQKERLHTPDHPMLLASTHDTAANSSEVSALTRRNIRKSESDNETLRTDCYIFAELRVMGISKYTTSL